MNLYSILENIVKFLHLHDDFNAQFFEYYNIKSAEKENEREEIFLVNESTGYIKNNVIKS